MVYNHVLNVKSFFCICNVCVSIDINFELGCQSDPSKTRNSKMGDDNSI